LTKIFAIIFVAPPQLHSAVVNQSKKSIFLFFHKMICDWMFILIFVQFSSGLQPIICLGEKSSSTPTNHLLGRKIKFYAHQSSAWAKNQVLRPPIICLGEKSSSTPTNHLLGRKIKLYAHQSFAWAKNQVLRPPIICLGEKSSSTPTNHLLGRKIKFCAHHCDCISNQFIQFGQLFHRTHIDVCLV
jgi:hypothetical protein